MVLCATTLVGTVSVEAKTLKESFSGGSYTNMVTPGVGGATYKKTAWAKTKGYAKKHYLRASVGKLADTGRVYRKGDFKVTATTGPVWVESTMIPSLAFPTAHAYYGH